MLTNACPHCGGDVSFEEDEYNLGSYKCFQCGRATTLEAIRKARAARRFAAEERRKQMAIEAELKTKAEVLNQVTDVPPKPVGRLAVHAYFEANKERILSDYKLLGYTETRRRWGLSSGFITRMLRDAGLGKRREKLKAAPKPLSPRRTMPDPFSTEKHVCTCGKTNLPAFPAFTDCKDGSAQIKRLEIWNKINQEVVVSGK